MSRWNWFTNNVSLQFGCQGFVNSMQSPHLDNGVIGGLNLCKGGGNCATGNLVQTCSLEVFVRPTGHSTPWMTGHITPSFSIQTFALLT